MPTKRVFSSGPELVPAEPLLLKKAQIARKLGVNPRTIDNWVLRKLIPSIHISARCRRYELEAVLATLRGYETAAAERPNPVTEATAEGGAQ